MQTAVVLASNTCTASLRLVVLRVLVQHGVAVQLLAAAWSVVGAFT